jgi:rhomboid protease GluP
MYSLEMVEVFRSARKVDCYDRALVLTALGVSALVRADQGEYVLEVEPPQAEQARAQLERYEHENRPEPPAPEAPRPYPQAWVGCFVYAAVLLGVAYAISNGLVRLDAFEVGDLDAGRVQHGQWWRAWTALTLHLDGPHLAANLGAGVWFGYLAARQIGSGTAWALVVTGAALANLLEGLLGPAEHRAVGASTAVFTALGLMSAYSWKQSFRLTEKWARRWGPLIAGVILLGWTGSAGEGTDLVAHVAGFLVGVALGIVAALPFARRLLRHTPQWLAGSVALASLLVAWGWALAS